MTEVRCPACHMPASSLLALQVTAEVRGVAKQATRDAETARGRIAALNPTTDPSDPESPSERHTAPIGDMP